MHIFLKGYVQSDDFALSTSAAGSSGIPEYSLNTHTPRMLRGPRRTAFGKRGEEHIPEDTCHSQYQSLSRGRLPWLDFSCRVEDISLCNVVKKLQKILLWYVSNLRLKKYFYCGIYRVT